jgi:NADPH2:quinone reductase
MSASLSSADPEPARAFQSRSVRLREKAASAESVSPAIEPRSVSRESTGHVVVQIVAAGVNPSDVKAAIGMMPHAVFPRTPGRDFAGIVVDGPPPLLNASVFGSSGDLGIRRDGTHATHLAVEAAGVVRKPEALSAAEAAGVGVPFVTAMEGFRRAGMPKPGETTLVLGLNGKVGQAAAQIASWLGSRVIGVVRKPETYQGHSQGAVDVIDSSSTDVAAAAILGRQIFIASIRQPVAFDIFALYRGRQTFVGIDTLALSSVASADLLKDLLPGFESGALRPFPILQSATYTLERAREAYATVMGSSRDRVVLVPPL